MVKESEEGEAISVRVDQEEEVLFATLDAATAIIARWARTEEGGGTNCRLTCILRNSAPSSFRSS